jgi:hypothetical protein
MFSKHFFKEKLSSLLDDNIKKQIASYSERSSSYYFSLQIKNLNDLSTIFKQRLEEKLISFQDIRKPYEGILSLYSSFKDSFKLIKVHEKVCDRALDHLENQSFGIESLYKFIKISYDTIMKKSKELNIEIDEQSSKNTETIKLFEEGIAKVIWQCSLK